MKACKDCRHFQWNLLGHHQRQRPIPIPQDPVTGDVERPLCKACRDERKWRLLPGGCGPDARYFE